MNSSFRLVLLVFFVIKNQSILAIEPFFLSGWEVPLGDVPTVVAPFSSDSLREVWVCTMKPEILLIDSSGSIFMRAETWGEIRFVFPEESGAWIVGDRDIFFLDKDLNLIRRKPLEDRPQAAVSYRDKIFIAYNNGRLEALGLPSLSPLWSTLIDSLPCEINADMYGPVVRGADWVVSVDERGNLLWRWKSRERLEEIPFDWRGVYFYPKTLLLTPERALVGFGVDSAGEGRILSFHRRRGEKLWERETPTQTYHVGLFSDKWVLVGGSEEPQWGWIEFLSRRGDVLKRMNYPVPLLQIEPLRREVLVLSSWDEMIFFSYDLREIGTWLTDYDQMRLRQCDMNQDGYADLLGVRRRIGRFSPVLGYLRNTIGDLLKRAHSLEHKAEALNNPNLSLPLLSKAREIYVLLEPESAPEINEKIKNLSENIPLGRAKARNLVPLFLIVLTLILLSGIAFILKQRIKDLKEESEILRKIEEGFLHGAEKQIIGLKIALRDRPGKKVEQTFYAVLKRLEKNLKKNEPLLRKICWETFSLQNVERIIGYLKIQPERQRIEALHKEILINLKNDIQSRQASLLDAVRSVVEEVREEFMNSGIRLSFAIEPGADDAMLFKDDLERYSTLLRNVLTNAFESFEGIVRKDPWIKVLYSKEKGELTERISISIEDNGKGMSEETLARCARKGFSTKGEKGLGLGLTPELISFVRARGDFKIESQEGQGTRVTLWIG